MVTIINQTQNSRKLFPRFLHVDQFSEWFSYNVKISLANLSLDSTQDGLSSI